MAECGSPFTARCGPAWRSIVRATVDPLRDRGNALEIEESFRDGLSSFQQELSMKRYRTLANGIAALAILAQTDHAAAQSKFQCENFWRCTPSDNCAEAHGPTLVLELT